MGVARQAAVYGSFLANIEPSEWPYHRTDPAERLRRVCELLEAESGSATDVYPPAKRSAVMRAVKGRDTGPERALRRLIFAAGGRYRLGGRDLPGKPDLAFPGRRLVVFVHGCFWHGHDCQRGARIPKANRTYWIGKVAANRARDLAHRAALEGAGWRVEWVWECELKNEGALKARIADWLKAPARPQPRS